MGHDRNDSAAETPRSEPEIIAPPRGGARGRTDHEIRMDSERRGGYRIVVTRLGPSGTFLLALGIVFFIVCVLFLLAGAILIWIPIAAILLAGSVLAAVVRKLTRS